MKDLQDIRKKIADILIELEDSFGFEENAETLKAHWKAVKALEELAVGTTHSPTHKRKEK